MRIFIIEKSEERVYNDIVILWGKPRIKRSYTMIRSEIRIKNGSPTLFVNGERIAENAYISYFGEKARYSDFAEAGYKLYSVPLYFATRSITEYNDIPPLDDGVFEKQGEPDYTIIDRAFRRILDVCPDAYIFPRVNMALPMWWEQANPDELCDFGNLGEHRRRHCFSSDKWAEETKRLLGLFIDHIEAADYRDRIIGYQLAGGNTEEWLAFDFRGSIGKRSREKFAEYVKERGISGSESEYYGFLSEMNSRRISEFAAYAKEKTDYRLIIGAFYGYTFECPQRTAAHHALGIMLEDKNIDFLCSPISYTRGRLSGEDHPCMLPLESLRRHGKLYFIENDARTHLSGPLFDVPHFDNVNYKPRTREHSTESLKMYFARSLINDHAHWWFDMGGGWYSYPLYMRMMRDFLEIKRESMALDNSAVAEVALVVDEHSLSGFDDEGVRTVARPVVSGIRYAMGLIGTPFAAFLASDIELFKNDYKAVILLEPAKTTLTKRVRSECKNVLVINAENKDITPRELREHLRASGVHLYLDRDAVIYANRSYLFLHTHERGLHDLKLREGERLREIYGDPIDPSRDILPENTSYLFRIERD